MALELNNGELNGRPITVTKCLSKDKADQKKQKKAGATHRIEAKAVKTEAKKEFTGAKANNNDKKNKKNKGKGGISGPKLLAKKIAPKMQKVTA